VADALHELRDRVAALSRTVEALLERQAAEQPTGQPPAEPAPGEPPSLPADERRSDDVT
jgi:hypothetical protein